MTDYIKREDAIKELFGCVPTDVHEIKDLDVIRVMLALPSADVAPVRHGRWIVGKLPMHRWGGEKIGEKSTWECSVCHDVGFWGYNYCPNCGAKMDGERKDNA